MRRKELERKDGEGLLREGTGGPTCQRLPGRRAFRRSSGEPAAEPEAREQVAAGLASHGSRACTSNAGCLGLDRHGMEPVEDPAVPTGSHPLSEPPFQADEGHRKSNILKFSTRKC